MPNDIDQVDELMKEYKGREAELLEILASMRVNVDQGNDGINKENDHFICNGTGGTTLCVANGDSRMTIISAAERAELRCASPTKT